MGRGVGAGGRPLPSVGKRGKGPLSFAGKMKVTVKTVRNLVSGISGNHCFKAKMHQIRFPLRKLTTLPARQTPSWISVVYFKGKRGRDEEGDKGRG